MKLNKNQLRELKECFKLFDRDNSGSISSRELKKLCESLGVKISDREVNELMGLMDRDGSGCIDFEEFATVMAEHFFREPTQAELEAAFDYFDKGIIYCSKKIKYYFYLLFFRQEWLHN